MKAATVVLFCCSVLSAARDHRTGSEPESHGPLQHHVDSSPRPAAVGGKSRGCADLTLVLDNWKFAIMSQVKDLLLHDHDTVLPEYGRIAPLSDALRDLYRHVDELKQRLSALSEHVGRVEAGLGTVTDGAAGNRTRVVRRRVLKRVSRPVRARKVQTEAPVQKQDKTVT